MSGGNQYLDQIQIELRNHTTGELFPLRINVFDNTLSEKWLNALMHLVAEDYHLEKNYCFLGWHTSDRNLDYLCDQINQSIEAINLSKLNYTIDDIFSSDNCLLTGPIGEGKPGLKINHDRFNHLHRYFEDLQGTSSDISRYYLQADSETRWHIRQLNLLCHEAECFILSNRKAIVAPEWRRPSQLMCWLNAPRFKLDENDYEFFGIDALHKPMGGVFVGVNKAVGKHHWEVFHDEGRDSRIDELTTTSLNSQTEATGDFDIEWAQSTDKFNFWKEEIADFTKWLVINGFDPDDKSLTIGHPQVGEIDIANTFGSTDINKVWNHMENYLDVYSISVGGKKAIYKYHWSDNDYKQQQISIIGK